LDAPTRIDVNIFAPDDCGCAPRARCPDSSTSAKRMLRTSHMGFPRPPRSECPFGEAVFRLPRSSGDPVYRRNHNGGFSPGPPSPRLPCSRASTSLAASPWRGRRFCFTQNSTPQSTLSVRHRSAPPSSARGPGGRVSANPGDPVTRLRIRSIRATRSRKKRGMLRARFKSVAPGDGRDKSSSAHPPCRNPHQALRAAP